MTSAFLDELTPRRRGAYILGRQKVIPALTSSLDLRSDILSIVDALAAAGLEAVEITLTTPHAEELVARIAGERPHLLVGVGTLESRAQAERMVAAGAGFIVSHRYHDAAVIDLCRARDIVMIPAAMTVSEIELAYRLGQPELDRAAAAFEDTADFVKVFPLRSLGGVDYLKELRRPCRHIPFCPSGGVEAANAADLIRNGAVAVTIAGALFRDPDLRRARATGDYAWLTERAAELMRATHPAIVSLGECMIEVLVEGPGEITEELLARYIAEPDSREGAKAEWRAGSLCATLDSRIEGRPEIETGEEIVFAEGPFRVFVRAAGDAYDALIPPAALGARTAFVSGGSACPAGRFLSSWYRRQGVSDEQIVWKPRSHSGAHFLIRGYKRYSRWDSAAARLQAADLRTDYTGVDVLHITGISQMISPDARLAALAAAKAAAARGAAVSYDLNDRPNLRESPEELSAAMSEVAPYITYLFLGAEESRVVLGLGEGQPSSVAAAQENALTIMQELTASLPRMKAMVITSGEFGATVGVPVDGELEVEHLAADLVPRSEVVEPVGAGDALVGGFLHAAARGFPAAAALQVGLVCAQLNTLAHGAAVDQDHLAVKESLRRHYQWEKADLLRL
jgi:2-dehydro-3-deoxyphosphogluconate aldolase/(4S)-4-hydroxy-2-oxoglutarate aldolase